jgi:ribosome assembly protein 4
MCPICTKNQGDKYFDIQDEDPVPFSFHVSLPEDETKPGAPTRIVVSKSLETDVLAHSSGAFSQEDILVVHCSPQSVFRVRPATRCSSTLSGKVASYNFLETVVYHCF